MSKLWLLKQEKNTNYDTFDSCIVVAKSAELAKLIHPYGNRQWNGYAWKTDARDTPDDTWAAPDDVTAEEIGTAKKGMDGVVLSSFNAGLRFREFRGHEL